MVHIRGSCNGSLCTKVQRVMYCRGIIKYPDVEAAVSVQALKIAKLPAKLCFSSRRPDNLEEHNVGTAMPLFDTSLERPEGVLLLSNANYAEMLQSCWTL